MIDGLREQVHGGDPVVILETDQGPTAVPTTDPDGRVHSQINIDPNQQFGERDLIDARPSTNLYHELSHSFDQMSGPVNEAEYLDDQEPDSMTDEEGYLVGVPNSERSATGLGIDHDGDPSTDPVPDPDQPYALTENGLRDEMGIPRRPYYGDPVQSDGPWGDFLTWLGYYD